MNKFTFLALGLLAATLGGCNRSDEAARGEIILHGNIDVRQVALAFDGNGRIAELRAEEGDRVKPGAVLAVLDTVSLKLQSDQAQAQIDVQKQNLLKLRNGSRPEEIAQAEARLSAARADAARADDDLARIRNISGRTQGRGVSAQDLDHASQEAVAARAKARELEESLRLARLGPRAEDVAGARAQVGASEAQLAVLRYQIGQGELRAPSDGVIRSRLLEVGDMASPQRPVFALVLDHPKWARVYVSEADLGRIRMGMAARVTSDSQPGQPVGGRIGYISSVAEFTPKSVETEELRTSLVYEVRVLVEDRPDRLRQGQPVTVRIETGARQ